MGLRCRKEAGKAYNAFIASFNGRLRDELLTKRFHGACLGSRRARMLERRFKCCTTHGSDEGRRPIRLHLLSAMDLRWAKSTAVERATGTRRGVLN